MLYYLADYGTLETVMSNAISRASGVRIAYAVAGIGAVYGITSWVFLLLKDAWGFWVFNPFVGFLCLIAAPWFYAMGEAARKQYTEKNTAMSNLIVSSLLTNAGTLIFIFSLVHWIAFVCSLLLFAGALYIWSFPDREEYGT